MAIVSFDNNNNNVYESGNSTIKNVEVESNNVILWFELRNGKIIRENYRLSKAKEKEKLRAAIEVILGSTPTEFETSALIGLPCYIELEDRPWKKDQTWTGVAAVLPAREEAKTTSSNNESVRIRKLKLPETKMSNSTVFDNYVEEE